MKIEEGKRERTIEEERGRERKTPDDSFYFQL